MDQNIKVKIVLNISIKHVCGAQINMEIGTWIYNIGTSNLEI